MTPELRARLLSLEDDDAVWRRVLAMMAYELYRGLVVPWSPHQEAMNLRLRTPRIGDYVYETTSSWRHEDWYRGTGFLQEVRQEPYPEHDDPSPSREIWVIRYGPAEDDICRWEDCSFIVVPVDHEAFRREVEELIVLPSQHG